MWVVRLEFRKEVRGLRLDFVFKYLFSWAVKI